MDQSCSYVIDRWVSEVIQFRYRWCRSAGVIVAESSSNIYLHHTFLRTSNSTNLQIYELKSMTSYHVGDSREGDTVTLHTIGRGFCGIVWAAEKRPRIQKGGWRSRPIFGTALKCVIGYSKAFNISKDQPDGTHVIQIQIPAFYGLSRRRTRNGGS